MGQGTARLIYVQIPASPLPHYYICQGSCREQKPGGKAWGVTNTCSFVIFFSPPWVSILRTERVFSYTKHYNEHFSWRSNRDGLPAAGGDSEPWAQDSRGPFKGTAVYQLLSGNAGRCCQEAQNLDFYVKAPGFKMLVTQHTMCGANKRILWAGCSLPCERCPPPYPCTRKEETSLSPEMWS